MIALLAVALALSGALGSDDEALAAIAAAGYTDAALIDYPGVGCWPARAYAARDGAGRWGTGTVCGGGWTTARVVPDRWGGQ